MIKNIIFDLGNVLLSFKPKKYLEINYPKDKKRLYENVFAHPAWLMLDKGTIDEKEAKKLMSEGCKDLEDDIEYILNSWSSILTPLDESIKYLKELKDFGYSIYLLSNFHKKAYREVASKYDFFKLFDEKVISSHVNMLKPETEIYEEALKIFDVKAHESVFFDDTFENVNSAKTLGINSILFTDVKSAKEKLDLLISRVNSI